MNKDWKNGYERINNKITDEGWQKHFRELLSKEKIKTIIIEEAKNSDQEKHSDQDKYIPKKV